MGLHKKDCPKAWDWCAAAAIGEACGVKFTCLMSDEPFGLLSSSVVAARSSALGAVLKRTLSGGDQASVERAWRVRLGLEKERSAWTRLEPVKALRETDELRAYAQRCPHINHTAYATQKPDRDTHVHTIYIPETQGDTEEYVGSDRLMYIATSQRVPGQRVPIALDGCNVQASRAPLTHAHLTEHE